MAESIRRVDEASRGLLLRAFWLALRDALESRLRNAQGDYRPDPKSERFPAWVAPDAEAPKPWPIAAGSLTSLVDGWWLEAKARNLKPSTHESYSNTMRAFVALLGHDDAGRVTKDDVIRFKDHRLATINPRSGKTISAKKMSSRRRLCTALHWWLYKLRPLEFLFAFFVQCALRYQRMVRERCVLNGQTN
ncbi:MULTISPECIES: hypothetical protein [Rhodopseudomonas]|uniref:hypothetical protein n=1 Tax=Rhodopseudomonas TaxID=1073 RepID=UPI001568C106|nr:MULTISPECIES: hypothetical protein [Rhodopseudomonas]MDF3812732.1 hypothetical protein [Rhodopseudomonas sp. BAL398]WOK15793.1 hypothetical protein RBJ75_16610 [Rhodopseudomonas sp. BAL398]